MTEVNYLSLKIIIEVFSYKVDGYVSLPESTGVLISMHCRTLDRVFPARLKCIMFGPMLTFHFLHFLTKKLVFKFRI